MKTSLSLSICLISLAAICEPVKSMLGSDGTERCEEWVPTAMDYVQDGLVAHWDGIENVGYGIHDDNATVWTDLTGNGWDVTLKSGAINNGRFIWKPDGLWHCGDNFDIRPSFSMSDVLGEEGCVPFSVSILVKVDRYNNMKRYVPFGLSSGSFGFYWRNLNTFYAYLPWSIGVGLMNFDDILATDMEFTIVTDGTYISLYHDGLHFKTAKCGDYTSENKEKLVFFYSSGQNPTYDDSWICTLKKAQVYDRALTADEVRYNYLVDVKRFGL